METKIEGFGCDDNLRRSVFLRKPNEQMDDSSSADIQVVDNEESMVFLITENERETDVDPLKLDEAGGLKIVNIRGNATTIYKAAVSPENLETTRRSKNRVKIFLQSPMEKYPVPVDPAPGVSPEKRRENGPLVINVDGEEELAPDLDIDVDPAEEEEHGCDVCGESFPDFKKLKIHLRTHANQVTHCCDVCGESFSKSKELKIHMKAHAGEKPYSYKCAFCGKVFKNADILAYHVKTHSTMYPHVCKTCGKSFKKSGKLNSHLRTHTGEKPHICPICNKGFAAPPTLRNHMRQHQGEDPYKCPKCDKGFQNKEDLRLHAKTHPNEQKPFSCTFCDDCFDMYSELRAHMKIHI